MERKLLSKESGQNELPIVVIARDEAERHVHRPEDLGESKQYSMSSYAEMLSVLGEGVLMLASGPPKQPSP